MENEQRHYELRSGSRSRSRTPLVQSSTTTIEPETLEHHYHLRNLSRERSHTPGEIVNVKRPGRILSGSSSKTNDQNVGTITETKKEIVTVDPTLRNKSKHIENSLFYERQKAKKKIFANGQTDNKEDSLINKSEKDDKSIFLQRTFTSDYFSEETEQDDTPHKPCSAHEIYKQAGDWWNVFPKTDYTYSEKSKCRYEIAPGILAMPNMSRRSIHSNTENPNQFLYTPPENDICEATNIEKEKETKTENSTLDEFYGSHIPKSDKSKVQYTKKHVEQYHRHREVIYAEPSSLTNSRSRQLLHSDLSLKRMGSRKCGITSAIDSDVELEETISNNYNQRNKLVQRFMSFVSIIILWFSKFLEFLKLKTVKRREYYATYKYQEYESKYSKIWKYVDHCLQYIYLFMVRVFFFDSWLLSHVSSTRRWIHQRSPKIFWVALLPLLLLTGTYIVQKQSFISLDSLRNIPYDVTETSNRIFNNIISLSISQSDLLVEYIKALKDLSLYFVPGVNVSSPEMP
ncbi:hypothetical protein WN51_06882 [Melipona quadrifasciata]|uniref:Uncharacterized protein n=1 Tax=Melipona quadrifasciata TaxID=166423 RepID=A0A0M8ZNS4_9HYME|nr:hypothetical protein WN51_06882 [Melipona quadrifasciata]